MKRRQGVALLLCSLSLVVLAACSPATPDPTTPPTTDPGPTTQAADPIADQDCEALVASDDLAAALGASDPVDASFTGLRDEGQAARDGLRCSWQFGEQGSPTSAQVVLAVEPAATADPEALAASVAASGTCETGSDLGVVNSGCLIAGESGGWWFEARFFVFSTAADQEALLPAVTDVIEQGVASLPAA